MGAPDQRYGEKTRYHAIRRARSRERHQDPPKGRGCPWHGQEMRPLGTDSPRFLTSAGQRDDLDSRTIIIRRSSEDEILFVKFINRKMAFNCINDLTDESYIGMTHGPHKTP